MLKAAARHAMRAALGALVLVLLAASPASAAPTWLAPVDLSAPGDSALFPHVAVDPRGNAVAVWEHFEGTNFVVQAAVRPAATGVWQAPVDLSAPSESTNTSPQVAVDRRGNAVAVWELFNGPNYVVQASVRPAASGVWQTPVDLSAAGDDTSPQVAVDRRGNAVAAWAAFNSTSTSDTVVQAAVRPAASGVWQAPVDVSATGESVSSPEVAVDPRGDAVAVWDRGEALCGCRTGTPSTVVQAAVRPAASGLWQTPVDLSAAGDNRSPKVAVDRRGNAVAGWAASNGASPPTDVVRAAVRPAASGVWQAPVDLSAPSVRPGSSLQVAVDRRGNAVAVWQRFDGADFAVQAAVRPAATGAWRTPVDVTAAGENGSNPQVAVDRRGDAVAVWERFNSVSPFDTVVRAAVRPATTGAWQAPVDVSTPDGNEPASPQVAVDRRGNAVAVWERFNGVNDVVQAAAMHR
jgi:hypothetical protein